MKLEVIEPHLTIPLKAIGSHQFQPWFMLCTKDWVHFFLQEDQIMGPSTWGQAQDGWSQSNKTTSPPSLDRLLKSSIVIKGAPWCLQSSCPPTPPSPRKKNRGNVECWCDENIIVLLNTKMLLLMFWFSAESKALRWVPIFPAKQLEELYGCGWKPEDVSILPSLLFMISSCSIKFSKVPSLCNSKTVEVDLSDILVGSRWKVKWFFDQEWHVELHNDRKALR